MMAFPFEDLTGPQLGIFFFQPVSQPVFLNVIDVAFDREEEM